MRETFFDYLDLVGAGYEVGKLIVTVRTGGHLPLDTSVDVRKCYFRASDDGALRVGDGTHDVAGDHDLRE